MPPDEIQNLVSHSPLSPRPPVQLGAIFGRNPAPAWGWGGAVRPRRAAGKDYLNEWVAFGRLEIRFRRPEFQTAAALGPPLVALLLKTRKESPRPYAPGTKR